MNRIIVPKIDAAAPEAVLQALAEGLPDLTPEMRKAAAYLLENQNEIGVSSMREIAAAAGVKPNTLVRMARSLGFDGYDRFREPFREEIRQGGASFPDRARWLQSLSKGGKLGGLFGDMASSAITNIEQSFAATDADAMKAAADAIVRARHCYVLGVGINHMLARGFAYLARMAVENVRAIPRDGSLAMDDIAHADGRDVLIAMTFKPYRTEVVDAVELAHEQGMTVIGISDSPASPLVGGSAHAFVLRTETPQFFPSTVAATAFMETLMAFVIAETGPSVVANIERFHERRHALGIYRDNGGSRQ